MWQCPVVAEVAAARVASSDSFRELPRLLQGQTRLKINDRVLEPENDSYTKHMRVRIKECQKCKAQKEILYRCRYRELKEWVFLCGDCLNKVKAAFGDTYQYGGTWKSKKK